jgi:hypothetical protein
MGEIGTFIAFQEYPDAFEAGRVVADNTFSEVMATTGSMDGIDITGKAAVAIEALYPNGGLHTLPEVEAAHLGAFNELGSRFASYEGDK